MNASSPNHYLEQALALHLNGDSKGAMALCEQALALDGQRADGWTLKGILAKQSGAWQTALEAYQTAIRCMPDYADAYNNIGNILKEQGQGSEALAYYQKALHYNPNLASAWHNQGLLLQSLGHHEEALFSFTHGVAANPNAADIHWDRALSLLLQGHLREGFQEYEWRWRRNQPSPRGFEQPEWGGEPLAGKSLLVYAEQGFGDTLLFMRFFPFLLGLRGRVILEVQSELCSLLALTPGVDQCIAHGAPLPAFDYHISLLSLPRLLGTSLESLPRTVPYLVPPLERTQYWRQRFAESPPLAPPPKGKRPRKKGAVATPALKVGLVWAGNANVKNDALRSPRLPPLLPLLNTPGVVFHALQKGDGLRDLEGITLPNNWVNLATFIQDFSDTAAIIAALDLIITSDTSVAHLAAAMGVPCWILLHHLPDWRWGLHPTESDWYPGVRLFRQTEAGRWDQVVRCVQTALIAYPPPVASHEQRALKYFANALSIMNNEAARAEELCWSGLRLTPEAADGWTIRGVLARRREDLLAAEWAFRQAAIVRPDYADAYYHLARVLRQTGRVREAAVAVDQCCALQPQKVEFLLLLSEIANELGETQRALSAATTAVKEHGANPATHEQLGGALTALRRFQEAETCFRQAIALNPASYNARFNLGVLLQQSERFTESVALFESLSHDYPDHHLAWFGLGVALHRSGAREQAEAAYQRSTQLNPNHAATSNNLAALYRSANQLRKALEQHRKSVILRPEFLEARAQIGHLSLFLCEWDGLEQQLAALVQAVDQGVANEDPPSPFPFLSFPVPITEAQQTRMAVRFSAALQVPFGSLPPLAPHRGSRLRIGYCTSDFYNHATAHLMLGLFNRHDRSRFETFVYSWGTDDGSHYRKRIMAECDHFLDFAGKASLEIAQAIRRDGIDILIDLKGHTSGSRPELFAMRPAPVQATYLGYPGSFGGEFMDYAIVDSFVVPPAQRGIYTECLLDIAHCYQINDCEQPIAEPQPSRSDCGLPEESFVYCCFCSHYKIEPTVFAIWMRILKAVPGSVFWLLNPFDGQARENLLREVEKHSVDPGRIVFAPGQPKEYHLSRLRNADLFLDTLFYNAHTTASDSLWAGVPVLTTPGQTFASRVGGSINHAAGLAELVMPDRTAYEAKAIALATTDREQLRAIRQRLGQQRDTLPLFDTRRFTQELEALYQHMWQHYLNQEGPA